MTVEKASIWEETIEIPTYGIGKPDKNPMFLEKRVYQGSNGKVYPFPVIDKILDEKTNQKYKAVFLENQYIKIMVLPELGGRIQRAYDKTNDYDFIYYNEVIKPALVGLTGPWISGGIEFNWPQHHRPTTFAPTDYLLGENEDGSCYVECSEVDQMYGTKGKMRFTLYPDKAYIQIDGQLYNRTNLPQTFLWWANPAVAVNEYTQSVFPPDVTAVYDHGKRDVSKFPIATGVYYKHDYGEGVDISRYKNIPVPTSYMCAHSDYDFVGGYDYQKKAGLLHVADHHVSPGKKQWTWGCGDFGKAWDRNLTDENGPYIELMTGMFCDNQPDFTWLKPFEEKTFTQYFMPYKEIGYVKNASKEAAMNLTFDEQKANISVYATSEMKNVRVVLICDGSVIYEANADISPKHVFEAQIAIDTKEEWHYTLEVYRNNGRKLLAYTPAKPHIEEIPDPMKPMKQPSEIQTVEELYLAGLHIEQYRHATYLPDDYYLEALKRDPMDCRANTAYGQLLFRRGLFEKADVYFQRATQRITEKNPNPYFSECLYNKGLSLFYTEQYEKAYDAFYKATWTSEQQEMSFYYLACMDCKRGEYELALQHIERSLVKNYHNVKARALKGVILHKLSDDSLTDIAKKWLLENLSLDAFDYISRAELGEWNQVKKLAKNRTSTYLEMAIDYAEAGFYEKAVSVLEGIEHPMAYYYMAYYQTKLGMDASCFLQKAANADILYCFPNKLEDIVVLEYAIAKNHTDANAPYLLGCLFYDRRQYEKAIALWETSCAINGKFPTVWRNLSLAYFNKRNDAKKAVEAMERAYALDESDARVLLELDQLYHKLNVSIEKRFAFLENRIDVVQTRDDLYIEYIKLLNLLGRHEEVLTRLKQHMFHPWEGGEGKVTTQYATAHFQLGRKAFCEGCYEDAIAHFHAALVFPENLGEGKLEGAKDNQLYYFLGLAYQKLEKMTEASEAFRKATLGEEEPSSALYYNDQPADLLLYRGRAFEALGDEANAKRFFHKLISYGEKHYYDDVMIDFFAVSLPDLQLFEDDLNKINRIHCDYLIGLGYLGLGELTKTKQYFENVLQADVAHQGVNVHQFRI